MLRALFVRALDGHEQFDYVMTRMLNFATPGGPCQCPGEALPAVGFARMLRPVLANPAAFTDDLAAGTQAYPGMLALVGSSCSFIGHAYQARHHLPRLPVQTRLVMADGMGHNTLALNVAWSLATLCALLEAAS